MCSPALEGLTGQEQARNPVTGTGMVNTLQRARSRRQGRSGLADQLLEGLVHAHHGTLGNIEGKYDRQGIAPAVHETAGSAWRSLGWSDTRESPLEAGGRGRSAEGDRRRLAAFLALDDLNDDALALDQVRQTGAHQRRAMDEHVLPAALDGHETEALSRI